MKRKPNNKLFWGIFLSEIAMIILFGSLCVAIFFQNAKPAKAEENVMAKVYVEMPNGEQVPWAKTPYSKIIIHSEVETKLIANAITKSKTTHSGNRTVYSNADVKQLVMSLADQANFRDKKLIHKVIKCESSWNPVAINRSSWDYGLWQINLRHNPEVTKECALDPTCATKWAISQIQAGNLWKWKNSKYCWAN